jgi:hypothetical protein
MTTNTVEIINYVDLAQFELVTILTPEFNSNTPVRIYSVPKDQMVQAGDLLYRRDAKTKRSKFFRAATADTIPYPRPKCSTVCMQLPYQLFVQLNSVTAAEEVESFNQELETALALPF